MSLCCRMDFKNFRRDAHGGEVLEIRKYNYNSGYVVGFILNVVFALFSFSQFEYRFRVSVYFFIRSHIVVLISVHITYSFCLLNLSNSFLFFSRPYRNGFWLNHAACLLHFATNPVLSATACIHVMHIYRESTIDCHLRLQY